MHFPVRRRRASWPMVLSLQVPPEFSSVSSRGCEWSVKRHRHGSRRKPPLTLFSTASLGRQPMDASAIGAPISRLIGLERKDAMSAIQIVCAVAVPLLWGYQFVAIKVGVTEFPPLFFLALRFLAIALLLVPFVKRPARQQFGPVAAISIFLGGLNFGLFYVGLGLGSGSMSAVAYQLATPFTVLLAWPLLAERPSLTTSAGVVLAFVGVVVLMSLLLEHGQLASLVTADERGWLALAYTIFIGGIVGFGLWFWLIARCSMGRVAPFGLLLPVFALISSVLFLGDRMTPKLIVGGLLAISGVAITQVTRRSCGVAS